MAENMTLIFIYDDKAFAGIISENKAEWQRPNSEDGYDLKTHGHSCSDLVKMLKANYFWYGDQEDLCIAATEGGKSRLNELKSAIQLIGVGEKQGSPSKWTAELLYRCLSDTELLARIKNMTGKDSIDFLKNPGTENRIYLTGLIPAFKLDKDINALILEKKKNQDKPVKKVAVPAKKEEKTPPKRPNVSPVKPTLRVAKPKSPKPNTFSHGNVPKPVVPAGRGPRMADSEAFQKFVDRRARHETDD